MIRVDLPKLDLDEIPQEQQAAALLRQISVLIEQVNVSLSSIDPSDILLAEGVTLEDYLKTKQLKKQALGLLFLCPKGKAKFRKNYCTMGKTMKGVLINGDFKR